MSFHSHSAIHFQSSLKYNTSFNLSQFAHSTLTEVPRDFIPGLFRQCLSFLFSSCPHVLSWNCTLESLGELSKSTEYWLLPQTSVCSESLGSGLRYYFLFVCLFAMLSGSSRDSEHLPNLLSNHTTLCCTVSSIFLKFRFAQPTIWPSSSS